MHFLGRVTTYLVTKSGGYNVDGVECMVSQSVRADGSGMEGAGPLMSRREKRVTESMLKETGGGEEEREPIQPNSEGGTQTGWAGWLGFDEANPQ